MKGTPTWKSHLLLAVLCLLLLQIALKMIRMERKWRQSPLFFRLCILWVWQHLEGVIYLVFSMPSSHTALKGLMHGLPQALQGCLYRSRKCRRFSIRAGERQQLGKEWIQWRWVPPSLPTALERPEQNRGGFMLFLSKALKTPLEGFAGLKCPIY